MSTLTPTTSRTSRPTFLRSRSASSALSTSSIKDKARLYIGLCPRHSFISSFSRTDINCDSYLRILLVGPKSPQRDTAGTFLSTVISLRTRADYYKWVRHVPTAEGVVRIVRLPKANFSNTDLTRLLLALWTKDDLSYVHERYRIQFTYIINVYCWTGARIGAFFNGSLCYKDIHLALQGTGDKKWLPPEYRPWNWASYGDTIVIGSVTGRVTFIRCMVKGSLSSW